MVKQPWIGKLYLGFIYISVLQLFLEIKQDMGFPMSLKLPYP